MLQVTLKLLPDQSWDLVGAVALWCAHRYLARALRSV
jgi:hypothetical protein